MRENRLHDTGAADQRGQFERDHDRILYSSYFQRLAGVTQVVRAGEGDIFHTRQQHTHKVAQIARRIAQNLSSKSSEPLDPEVVASAALAHDLGHPPFGHVGEHVLDELVRENGGEGYEGNAQTFRIITKLAVRYDTIPGLNLTRAVACAVLKYPWLREAENPDRSKKWSAYASEAVEFNWARKGQQDGRQCLEAQVMDWADDIAYSVHDLEDFHRCNIVPWTRILNDESERDRIIESAVSKWHGRPSDAADLLKVAFGNLLQLLDLWQAHLQTRYDGTRELRASLREMTSHLVGNFIRETKIGTSGGLEIPPVTIHTVMIMKQITRDYIIANPALAAQQKGHERIIRELFQTILSDTAASEDRITQVPRYLPKRLEYIADLSSERSRFVADCISGLTEREVTELHARLTGASYGSVLDPIVR